MSAQVNEIEDAFDLDLQVVASEVKTTTAATGDSPKAVWTFDPFCSLSPSCGIWPCDVSQGC